jgi:hypothetical protein
MSESPPENSEFRPEKLEITSMSACAEAASLLRSIAEPRPVGDTVKAAINRASRRVSAFLREPMRPGRAEDIWRGEARAIRAEEIDAIRRAAEARLHREARHEFTQLDARISRLEALLVQDAEFHGPEADALGSMARDPHRAVDRGGR